MAVVAVVSSREQMWTPAPLLPLEQQADLVVQAGAQSLLYCQDAWAVNHFFTNRETGEVIPARCNKWTCPHCGSRKVDEWRQKVELAQPTLFVTLTKVGKTVEEAARTLTTWVQYIRRGSRGRGRGHVGARPAYRIEFFAVLEEHSDFERNGFHWHLLVHGVDFLPNEVVSEALRSATGGRSYITKVRPVKRLRSVGYVTKYLTKDVQKKRRGVVRQEQRVAVPVYEGVPGTEYTASQMVYQEDGTVDVVTRQRYTRYETKRDSQGRAVLEEVSQVVERPSKAHRVRYSKRFFPAKTKDLWALLCSGLSPEEVLERVAAGSNTSAETGGGELPGDEEQQAGESSQAELKRASVWMLQTREPVRWQEAESERRQMAAARGEQVPEDRQQVAEEAYQRQCRGLLLSALEDVRAGRRKVNRRVLSIWKQQRKQVA